MTVGVLGGGQLGRMLALAGYPLGLRFRAYDHAADAVAGHVAPLTVGAFNDLAALDRWVAGEDGAGDRMGAGTIDVVTYEFENVPVRSAAHLASRVAVFPPPRALEESQDRLREKTLFRRLGIATPEFEAVDTREDLERAVRRLGLPAVLKTRRLGYDGKGQALLRTAADVDAAWTRLASSARADGGGAEAAGGAARTSAGADLILEEFVRFDREVSILAVRSRGARAPGGVAFYPLVQNEHAGGILRVSIAPAPGVGAAVQAQAEDAARAVMDALGYVGVLAIEWFIVGDRLLANEMAPRVHNSGHWTIEGAATSQFENHVRAVCGLPLGSTEMRWPGARAAMVNLIGAMPPRDRMLGLWNAHVHDYGKEPRSGRKLGHVTIVEGDERQLLARVEEIRRRCGVASG